MNTTPGGKRLYMTENRSIYFDEVILGICATEDIEQDIIEADEISTGIIETLSECKRYLQSGKEWSETRHVEDNATADRPPTVHMRKTDTEPEVDKMLMQVEG